MKVEIGFDLSVSGIGDWLTLDDPTKGVLDGTTYKLSGEVLVDVTDKVRDVSVRRGRSRTLEKFTAGNAAVILDNRDRSFDPLYASSPYYGQIVPRKQVRVSVNGTDLFTGNVEQWSWDYDLGGDATATTSATDGFATLAQAVLAPGTATSQASGARVAAILNEVAWPTAARAISTGSVTLDADVIGDNVNALAYLQKVELSEAGALFVNASGGLTFLAHTDLEDFTTGAVTFGPAGVPFTQYEAASLTEEMKNSVAVTWSAGSAAGGTAVASDATSQAAYGLFDVAYDTLLASSGDAQNLADWQVSTYKDPTYRINSITVALHGLTMDQAAAVVALELGDNVMVEWTPNGIGAAISQDVIIDAIDHSARPGEHFVTFTLSQSMAAFMLDSTLYGVLDTNRLGF